MNPIGDPLARAVSAYLRRIGKQASQPSRTSAVEAHSGHELVVLRNVGGVLAVYTIRQSGQLKWLDPDEWPRSLT